MSYYGVGYDDVYSSIWCVTETIHQYDRLGIKLLTHKEQKQVIQGFSDNSDVGFDNCIDAVDGLLVWTNKTTNGKKKR